MFTSSMVLRKHHVEESQWEKKRNTSKTKQCSNVHLFRAWSVRKTQKQHPHTPRKTKRLTMFRSVKRLGGCQALGWLRLFRWSHVVQVGEELWRFGVHKRFGCSSVKVDKGGPFGKRSEPICTIPFHLLKHISVVS